VAGRAAALALADPRLVLLADELHVTRSLRKARRSSRTA
jgi:Leu/Phe-tRNA-protein transferase